MTVKDLLDKLSTVDPTTEVLIFDAEWQDLGEPTVTWDTDGGLVALYWGIVTDLEPGEQIL